MSKRDEISKLFNEKLEIQDKGSLLDSDKELMKKYHFWYQMAQGLMSIDKDCPDYDIDSELFNQIKQAVGTRSLELGKIIKNRQKQ